MDHIKHLRHAHRLRKRNPLPQPQGGTKTVVEVVFVTSSPNSDGGDPAGAANAGGTVTEVVTAAPTSGSSPQSSKKQQSVGQDEENAKSQTTMRTSSKNVSSSIISSSLPTSTPSRTTPIGASATLGSSSSTSSETGPATNSAGLTIGAYAGIVGGGVALILILIVAAAIILKKRKNSSYEKPEDEKNLNRLSFTDRDIDSPFSPVPTPKPAAAAVAPKLEIRPMTQFDSSFFPAGNADTLKTDDRPIRAPPPALSFDKNLLPGPFETPEPSPAFSAFSDSSNMTLPIQGATGAPSPNSSPVHRVMVDFKPSMADELELTANEVVRLLHEYDDGWALCIRMDRTQQGVCPRTCLSPRPVKPRPPPNSRAPPPPPQMRGPGGPSRPYSPGGNRPQSPGFGPGSGSRPQSPRSPGGPNSRPPMSPKGMPGPPRRPMGPDSNPESPMGARAPHPLSRVQRDDDVQYHAM
ncbi:hypothetical protein H072_11147 [Dactylellina haptotyla CBS 200.50]|uniref:SH3 domain-containing protein n=1 Tax=Dactylellina haptotyla (strain CBS 200.50) TaxID=1284197 RepID=S8BJP1_DACHA|nr:hypothetical protein H072_11147 [Dactylellina haptotyla CBS 200.50]